MNNFSAISWREKVTFLMRSWWCPLCIRPTCPSWNFIVLAHRNNSLLIDMLLYLDTLFCFQTNQSLLLLL